MRATRIFLAAAILASSAFALGSASAETPACSVPVVSAPAFSGFGHNDLAWFLPEPAVEGSGFKVEIAREPVLASSGGGFAGSVDGEPNVLRTLNIPQGFYAWPVEDLPEETLYYHIRVQPGLACTAPLDPWSNIVATTQDHTPPEVAIDNQNMQVFLPGEVTLTGTATDEPGPDVDEASGATSVRVRLDYTTPVLGVFNPPVRPVVVAVEDDAWAVTYESLPAGTYRAVVRATDLVGNDSDDIAIQFVVVNA